jgi:DNA replicative helicase MCM subunit Mcm2 (Cdc46/Mcm family)
MAEEPSKCEININSIASLKVSRRDLVKLRDRISYLDANLNGLERDHSEMQNSLSEMTREVERLKQLFLSLFGEEIRGVVGAEEVQAELIRERSKVARTPEQITLGISEVTREHIQSVLDAIKREKEESQGNASREAVLARAKAIGIKEEDFEDILHRLRRAGALVESEGTLRLI